MKLNFDVSNNEVEINEADYSQILNIKQNTYIEDAQILAWEISNILKNNFKVILDNIYYTDTYIVINISKDYKKAGTDRMQASFYFSNDTKYFYEYETAINIKDIELHNEDDQESIGTFQKSLVFICLNSDIKKRLKKMGQLIKGI